jgi:hypothetical protein
MDTFQDFHNTFDGFSGSPDGLGATLRTLGEDPVAPQPQLVQTTNPGVQALKVAWALASVAGGVVGAYHGYKRNDSVGWAIGWSLLGSLFPVIVIPVAYAQGIGERKRGR